MANNKSSAPVSTHAPGVMSSTVAPALGTAGSPAAGGPAAGGGTGSGSSPAGGVLAALGVTNSGYTQVKVGSLVSTKFETKVSKRLSGVENYLPAGTSLVLNGTAYTVASIVSVLQAVLALFTAKATAQAQAKATVSAATAALKAELPTASQFLSALDTALVGIFGKGNPVLTNFGLSTGVKKTPSVATQAKAKGTAALTRKARNTLGKVQRLKVTGGTAQVAVTGPDGEVLPGSSPGAATPPAAPAPAGSGSNGSTSGK
ncbi:MAG: hypothetical protein ACYDCL_00220 [Myxococcales bacterium]